MVCPVLTVPPLHHTTLLSALTVAEMDFMDDGAGVLIRNQDVTDDETVSSLSCQSWEQDSVHSVIDHVCADDSAHQVLSNMHDIFVDAGEPSENNNDHSIDQCHECHSNHMGHKLGHLVGHNGQKSKKNSKIAVFTLI